MTAEAALAVVALACGLGAWRLPGRSWARRSPHTAIVLWQATGFACGIATIGALAGAAVASYNSSVLRGVARLAGDAASGAVPRVIGPIELGALLAGVGLACVLLGGLAWVLHSTVRIRRRQRLLLGLVGQRAAGHPELTLVDHPVAAAYCLPGLRSRIVVSAGAMSMLSPPQLSAVVAHERAHAAERHDLVLLPFTSLRALLSRSRVIRRICDEVEMLVEMAADDRARRLTPAPTLAAALARFGSAHRYAAPAGALAVTGEGETGSAVDPSPALEPRIRRLLHTQPLPRAVGALVLAGAAVVALTPLALIIA